MNDISEMVTATVARWIVVAAIFGAILGAGAMALGCWLGMR